MKRWQVVLLPIFGSLLLYSLALAFPALQFLVIHSQKEDTWRGFEVLIMGWLGVFYGQIGWYANPLYYVVFWLIVARMWRAATILSGITIAIGMNTVLLFFQKMPHDAAGHLMQLKFLQPGFFFWMASFLVLFCWSLWQLQQGRSRSKIVQ